MHRRSSLSSVQWQGEELGFLLLCVKIAIPVRVLCQFKSCDTPMQHRRPTEQFALRRWLADRSHGIMILKLISTSLSRDYQLHSWLLSSLNEREMRRGSLDLLLLTALPVVFAALRHSALAVDFKGIHLSFFLRRSNIMQ